MRRHASAALLLALLALSPFATACYAPRVQGCRDPMSDFSSITSVVITNAVVSGGFEGGAADVSYQITAQTSGTTASAHCIAVHSELRSGTSLLETIDTPIRASVSGGVITTTPMFHYHLANGPMTVHVTALGQTMDATVTRFGLSPDAGFVRDGSTGDAAR